MPPSLKPEDGFVDAFDWKTVVGAVFVGLIMMPAAIYVSLFAGQGLDQAAIWVTIILFAELARRSVSALKKQEMYLLYYVAAGMSGGGVFAGLIWNQFLRQSREAAAFGVAQNMPLWAAPLADSPALLERKLWHPDWLPAILLVLVGQVLSRFNWFGIGYALFRLTSDVERLPFPMATVAAEGAVALAESPEKKESWRWRIFSIGSMLGLGFGLIYVGIPAITYLIFASPLSLLPIPWKDFTPALQNLLPAAPLAVSFDLGSVLWGMVVPYWAVVGTFVMSVLSTLVANPILYKFGYFPTWRKGMSVLDTQFATSFDFWLPVGAGVALAVAGVGVWQLGRMLVRKEAAVMASDMELLLGKEGVMRFGKPQTGPRLIPKNRGDFPIWIAIGMFLLSTAGYVWVCHILVPRFPMWILIFFGFVWTPITSYISARMIGLTGNGVWFPYVKEGSFVLSGYKGVDIWFAPIPLNDFGGVAAFFKQLELTKTKFTSIIKAEILMFPISIGFSFLFWAFLWHLSTIPSYAFPFANKLWPFNARTSSLWMTATAEGRSWLLEALLKPNWVGVGFGFGWVMYWIVGLMKWPIFLFYGAVGGVNSQVGGWPALSMIGALLGKYWLAPRYGEERWYRWVPVLCAGFACGMGLISMLAVGITIVQGTVVTKPF
jgi:hypothetical protein